MNAMQRMYFVFMTALLKHRDHQHSCNTRDVTSPALQWSFERNLTCGESRIALVAGGFNLQKRAGERCTYTYSCPMDPPGPHRSTTLTCQLTGEWAGRLPDCSADDRLVSYVLKLLTAGRSNTTRDVAAKRGKEAQSVPALAEYAGTAKKSATSNAAKLGRYCKAQKICERTNHISDCWNTMKYSDVRPRSRTMRKAMLGLCFFCFKTFCARPTMITLL